MNFTQQPDIVSNFITYCEQGCKKANEHCVLSGLFVVRVVEPSAAVWWRYSAPVAAKSRTAQSRSTIGALVCLPD